MKPVVAVVVTYNRQALLKRCLASLQTQTFLPDEILVLDNASTDGTEAWMNSGALAELPRVTYIRLPRNLGGAGGFSEGLKLACEADASWVWMMDDDAEPFEDALEHLLRVAVDPANVYGSLAVRGEDTSWTTTLVTPTGGHSTDIAEEIPAIAQVQSLPFLGFLIHRNLVERIGLPDAGYFIAADDVEYCLRAERAGALIMVAGRSRIDHPRADSHQARILGRNFIFLRIPPWKRYYDTRNRLLIARKYYGYRFYTRTIPGSFLRLGASLAGEKQRAMQIWAFVAGMIDGLLGLKGRRHNRWRISQ